MSQPVSVRITYIAILISFLIIGTLFAWRVPDWQAPDEPAHYNYIAEVASGELLPVIEMGDWDNDYLEELKANDFAFEFIADLDTVQYENHQPPLYYWISAPVFMLNDGNLFALRMVSVIMATITVALAYHITINIFPERKHLALAVMSFVAFLPQNVHMLASVNNDALAGLVIALLMLLCIKYLKGENVKVWHIGLVTGITFITKTTIYFMAGVILIVIFMRWRQSKEHDFTSLIRQYIRFGIPAGVFALSYWGRNIRVYGFPDFLGLQAHDEIVVGQLRRAEFIATQGMDAYWREAFFTTFHSFLGQFGWMEARLADAIPLIIPYALLLLFLGLSGLLIYAIGIFRKEENIDRSQIQIWMMFGFILLLALAQYLYYNITFVQFQGRYLFVAIIPIAVALATGIDSWRKLLFEKFPHSSWLTVALFAVFAPLDVYLIWRVIPCAVGC